MPSVVTSPDVYMLIEPDVSLSGENTVWGGLSARYFEYLGRSRRKREMEKITYWGASFITDYWDDELGRIFSTKKIHSENVKTSGGIWGHVWKANTEMGSYGVFRFNWPVSLMICPLVVCVEHGNEPLGSVKSRPCIGQRSDWFCVSSE